MIKNEFNNFGNSKMIAMSKTLENPSPRKPALGIQGIGVIRVPEGNPGRPFDVIYQKGVGMPLLQNIFELFKQEVKEKEQGTSVIPLEDFTLFLSFFPCEAKGNKIMLIYLDEKDNSDNYPSLYMHAKGVKRLFKSNLCNITTIKQTCNDTVEIPREEDVYGIFIINEFGVPLFANLNKNRLGHVDKVKGEIDLIGGFISAIFSLSKYLIEVDSGGKLKEINFGNQIFYVTTKDGLINAFLVKKMTPLINRYMQIMIDEFIDRYKDKIQDFTGDVTQFKDFETVVNQYFII